MEGRLDGRVLHLLIFFVASLCIQDPAHFLVTAAARTRSGSRGRNQSLPNSHKRLGERRDPSQEEQNAPTPLAYRSNIELLEAMRDYATRCNNISRLYTIGKSVKGVPLMVLEISDFPGQSEPEPAFKYVGNMHGDEPSGRELTLYLAEWLCANYLKDPLATIIVQKVHLHLLPSMNPDGFERKSRNNANDIDLNRDFPDQFFPSNNNESGRQPETKAIMRWVRNTKFTASASLHEGALVASYGWDGTLNGRTGYAESPDDAGFRYMAFLYAYFNPAMRKSPDFRGGVTNGAAWYPLYGGMQDWNYIYGNCFEITLEMNDAKWPDISKIPELWEQHRHSMLELVASVAKSGVHGRVISSADGRPLPALITVKGNRHPINASSSFGDYHRILAPGKTYELTAKLSGYIGHKTTVVLSQNKATTLDFVLDPVPTSEAYQEAHPKLWGLRRTPISSDMGDWVDHEELAIRCAEAGLAQLKPESANLQSGLVQQTTVPWLSRKQMRSLGRRDLGSDVTVEQFRVISVGATVILVAAFLYVLVRWRGSLRAQHLRFLMTKF